MAMWHLMLGMGMGLIFTVGLTLVTMMSNSQTHRPTRPKVLTYVSNPEDNCAICLFNMTHNDIKYLNCGHAFHDECVNNLRRFRDNKCPTCREVFY